MLAYNHASRPDDVVIAFCPDLASANPNQA